MSHLEGLLSYRIKLKTKGDRQDLLGKRQFFLHRQSDYCMDPIYKGLEWLLLGHHLKRVKKVISWTKFTKEGIRQVLHGQYLSRNKAFIAWTIFMEG